MVIITKEGKSRWKDDFYPTPLPLCEKIVSSIVAEFPMGGRVLDPGCGNGHFGVAIKHHFPDCHLVGIDTVDRLSGTMYASVYDEFIIGDYTRPGTVGLFGKSTGKDFELVIGNPPFKHAQRFVEISHAICRNQIVFLLKLAFLEGQYRAEYFWPKYPPNDVFVLDARVSWDGSGKSNDQAHAVYNWEKKYPPIFGHTSLRWLNWR